MAQGTHSVFCGNVNEKEIQKERGYMYTYD